MLPTKRAELKRRQVASAEGTEHLVVAGQPLNTIRSFCGERLEPPVTVFPEGTTPPPVTCNKCRRAYRALVREHAFTRRTGSGRLVF